MLECIGPLRKPTRSPLRYPFLPHLLAIIVPHYSPPQNPRTAVCREQSRFHRWIGWTLTQYLPKGSDLSIYSQDELDAIALSLNTRPRARLNYESPLVVYTQHITLLQAPTTTVN